MGRDMRTKVTLDFFIGKTFELTGVDDTTISKKIYGNDFGNASVINFILDGVVYSAIEDPSDGYRSSMEEIVIVDDVKVKNVFQPCQVKAHWSSDEKNEVVEFVDTTTGKTVLAIGTANTDDYYPSFVGGFQPKNMASNQPTSEGRAIINQYVAERERKRMEFESIDREREVAGWATW